jgi:hypothetical protein
MTTGVVSAKSTVNDARRQVMQKKMLAHCVLQSDTAWVDVSDARIAARKLHALAGRQFQKRAFV